MRFLGRKLPSHDASGDLVEKLAHDRHDELGEIPDIMIAPGKLDHLPSKLLELCATFAHCRRDFVSAAVKFLLIFRATERHLRAGDVLDRFFIRRIDEALEERHVLIDWRWKIRI